MTFVPSSDSTGDVTTVPVPVLYDHITEGPLWSQYPPWVPDVEYRLLNAMMLGLPLAPPARVVAPQLKPEAIVVVVPMLLPAGPPVSAVTVTVDPEALAVTAADDVGFALIAVASALASLE